ncbi:VWA domain-containing protein [Acidobacteria bacterium AH-259-A15]|nr:VWA domain-containing protein [Acidobacteria bacterium AH-259-A15]
MLTHGLLIASLLFGQQQDVPQKQQEEGFRIGVAVDQVFLSVNARSIEGGFVQDLTKEEFQVSEDGVKQGIVNFYSAGVPVHVILLIDISGSTREAQGHIRRAALGFAKSLGPEDRVTIVTFNDAPRLIVDWTNDIERIELALGSIYAKGYTVLNDALYVVFDDLLKEVQGKKAVIVLTDGIDNNSMVGQDEVVNLATRSETMVYVVSKLEEYWAGAIAARMEYRARAQWIPKQLTDEFIIGAKRFLKRLAQQTGGKVLDSKAFNSLTDVYQQVAEELKNQYYISYIPSNIMKDGKWRNVEVRVNLPGVVVSTRPGYYAPLEPGGN